MDNAGVDRLLKRAEVEEIVGLGKSTLYRRIEGGTFPKPVNTGGGRAVRWRLSDVRAWLGDLEHT